MFEITAEQIMLNQSYASWEEALAASGELLLKISWSRLTMSKQCINVNKKSVCISVTSWHYLMRKDKMNKFLKEGICFIQVPDGVNFGTEADRKIATLLFVVALKVNGN